MPIDKPDSFEQYLASAKLTELRSLKEYPEYLINPMKDPFPIQYRLGSMLTHSAAIGVLSLFFFNFIDINNNFTAAVIFLSVFITCSFISFCSSTSLTAIIYQRGMEYNRRFDASMGSKRVVRETLEFFIDREAWYYTKFANALMQLLHLSRLGFIAGVYIIISNIHPVLGYTALILGSFYFCLVLIFIKTLRKWENEQQMLTQKYNILANGPDSDSNSKTLQSELELVKDSSWEPDKIKFWAKILVAHQILSLQDLKAAKVPEHQFGFLVASLASDGVPAIVTMWLYRKANETESKTVWLTTVRKAISEF